MSHGVTGLFNDARFLAGLFAEKTRAVAAKARDAASWVDEKLSQLVKQDDAAAAAGSTSSGLELRYLHVIDSKVMHESQMHVSLYTVLSEGTREIHKVARKNEFLLKHIQGKVCETGFTKYLINLLALHEALEEAQKIIWEASPAGVFIDDSLWRSVRIREDIKSWERYATFEEPYEAEAVTRAYCDHLIKLAKEEPILVVAHMWAIYASLIYGGSSLLGNAIKPVFNDIDDTNEPNKGVLLFKFAKIEDAAAAKLVEYEGLHGVIKDDEERRKQYYKFVDSATAEFKQHWFESLNKVLDGIENKDELYPRFIEEATKAFQVILDFITQGIQSEKVAC